MHNDVVRRKSVEINREQAEQVVRLMSLALGRPYRLEFERINAHICGCYHTMPIAVEPMSSVGTFNPMSWKLSGYPPRRAEHTKTHNIVRAVFQPQLSWICTYLPDWGKLADLVGAMEPGTWAVGENDYVKCIQYWPEGQYLPTDAFLFTKDAHLSSRSISSKIDKIPACERLNRFLPWLIRLAGGKVQLV